MSQLTILQYPHPILKQVSTHVVGFDETLKSTLQTMLAMMYQDKAVGLAANQVGLTQRFFVMDVSEKANQPLCLVNPEIIAREGETLSEEGCCSLPGIFVKVKRAEKITVNFQDANGQPQTLTTDGLMALCIQHEIDHLDGILAIDHLSKLKRALTIKKMGKNKRESPFTRDDAQGKQLQEKFTIKDEDNPCTKLEKYGQGPLD